MTAKEIIYYLKEIKEDGVYGAGCEKKEEALDMAIEALEQESKTGWIPVSERLPEKSGQYLVTVKKGYMLLGLWCGIKDDWINVIAWMPLPEPYKKKME